MKLFVDIDTEDIRIRDYLCECEDPDCETHVVIAQAGPEDVWATMGLEESHEKAERAVRYLLDPTPDPDTGMTAADIAECACALFGMSAAALEDPECATTQLATYMKAEGWLFCVPRDVLWRTRRYALGAPLTRVEAALRICRAAAFCDERLPPVIQEPDDETLAAYAEFLADLFRGDQS